MIPVHIIRYLVLFSFFITIDLHRHFGAISAIYLSSQRHSLYTHTHIILSHYFTHKRFVLCCCYFFATKFLPESLEVSETIHTAEKLPVVRGTRPHGMLQCRVPTAPTVIISPCNSVLMVPSWPCAVVIGRTKTSPILVSLFSIFDLFESAVVEPCRNPHQPSRKGSPSFWRDVN